MKTEVLPYVGILSSIILMLYFQIKESVEYWMLQYKNKVNQENTKFDFNKSTLAISFSMNILLICIIWAIYNNYNL